MYVYGLRKFCDLVCIWRSGLYGAYHLAMAKFTGPCITGFKVARKVVYVQRRQRVLGACVSPSQGWKDVLSRQPPACIDSTKGSATHAWVSPSQGWKDVLSRQPPSGIDSTKGSATHLGFTRNEHFFRNNVLDVHVRVSREVEAMSCMSTIKFGHVFCGLILDFTCK